MAENEVIVTDTPVEEDIHELKKIRLDKLNALKAENNDPFTLTSFPVDTYAADIKADVDSFEGKTVTLAGRMMSRRSMGKASFANIADNSGNIQIYVRRDDVGEDVYNLGFKKWDIGDIIGITGFAFVTKTGEISVHAQSVTLLAKSLLPLPEKFHGLTNTDMRYRQRYVDLIVNPEV